ncbi:M10 family metallopeptidase C-terminal domain-containing protein [Sphingomonas sp. CJ99]
MAIVRDFRALLSGASINGQPGQAAFISFSFPTVVPDYLYRTYSASGLATFQAYSSEQQAVVRQAIAAFSAVSGITFFEVAPGEGDLKFMGFDLSALDSTAAGFAYFPDNGFGGTLSSDVFMGIQFMSNYGILLHEIGHALGLKHPFEGENTLAEDLDNFSNTVMSYTSGGSQRDALKPFDIQAMRELYGDETKKGTQVAQWSWDATSLTLTQNGTDADERLFGIGGTDVIDGKGGDDVIIGREGNDTLTGGSGNDRLVGGLGRNTLSGGDGNDQLSVEADGFSVSFAIDGGAGTDSFEISAFAYRGDRLSVSDALAAGSTMVGVESVQLSIVAPTHDMTVIGSTIRDTIFAGRGSDIIEGLAGDDYISASLGNDSVLGGDGNDSLLGDAGDDVLDGGAGNDNLTGGAGIDRLIGGAGNDSATFDIDDLTDSFDGGAGTDTINLVRAGSAPLTMTSAGIAALGLNIRSIESVRITGGSGDDVLQVESGFVTVDLSGGEGNDTLYGSDGTTGFGSLRGGAGDDVIRAGTGRHFMYGDAGADRFVFTAIDQSTDIAQDQIEDFQSGIDRIDLSAMALYDVRIQASGTSSFISATGALGRFQLFVRQTVQMSDLILSTVADPIVGTSAGETLTGTANADFLRGEGGVDTLIGLAGNDILDGGSGNDRLYGGLGDDSYTVDSQGDLVFEDAGQGMDTVVASTNYYLFANVERLILAAGSANWFGVGNALSNAITGNQGSNLLLGGGGSDRIEGAGGDDQLFGETGDDILIGGGGVDYLAGGADDDRIEGGDGADALYGEGGNDDLFGGTGFFTDILVGGDGADVLDGNSGEGDYDLLDGGAGDDLYFVDTPDDLTFEAVGGGTDGVVADIRGAGYYLYANVETLTLMGETPFGVGNALDNVLIGSETANWLLGGAGNDRLNGGGGNDVLFGEAGADRFEFSGAFGIDTIGDFAVNVDKVVLGGLGLTWSTLQPRMTEIGGSTAIQLADGSTIILAGVAKASLDADDFLF